MTCFISTDKFKSILSVTLVAYVLNSLVDAFNVDTDNVRILSGTKGSQFGYTMSFDEKAVGESHINLLVGAPKAKVEIEQTDYNSGSLITCYDVLNAASNCKEEVSSLRFPPFIKDRKSYINEGYGMAFTVSENGNRLVCSPCWSDLRHVTTYHISFMPGRCVVFLERQGKFREGNVVPFYGRHYMTEREYYHGLAGFGLSTDVYENFIFAIGSPGLTIFEGGVTIIDFRGDKWKEVITTTEYRNTLNTTAYGYLGYQVKFGRFCKPPGICLAASAPQLDAVGVVRLYIWVNDDRIVNFQTLQGEKAWSYFGYTLCAADTDHDEMDELLVGAPYYSDDKHTLDIGKVYLYKRESISKYFYLHQKLDGKKIKYGRFGSAVQVIGDIDLDGYVDVAVGAPGEEEASGCIYIYMGSPNGLVNSYDQRICAKHISELKSPLSGFGSAISGGTRSVKDQHPIFAASAVQSDTVLLFKSKPVLEVTSTLTSMPDAIDTDTPCAPDVYASDGPCTVLSLCLKHQIREGRHADNLQKNLYFQITMKIDTQSKSGRAKRASFVSETGDDLVDSLEMFKLVENTGTCVTTVAVVSKKQLDVDRFTPIQVEITYRIDKSKSDVVMPILDPHAERTIYHMITFANDCGSDNICHVDLKVEGHLHDPYAADGDQPQIVFGYTKEIAISVSVTNMYESCYWTKIDVKLSQPLDLNRFTSDRIRKCESSFDASNSKGTTITCNYYQPLDLNATIGVTLTFDTGNLAEDTSLLTISAEAFPADQSHHPEKNPLDNRVDMSSNVYISADVQILGVAEPLEITIEKAKKISFDDHAEDVKPPTFHHGEKRGIMLNHKYLIKNKGPSFLPKTTVYLRVPVYIPDGSQLVSWMSVFLVTGDQIKVCSQQRSPQDPASSSEIGSTSVPFKVFTEKEISGTSTENLIFKNPSKRNKRSRTDDDAKSTNPVGTYFLTCDVTPEYCIVIRCDIPNVIPAGGHAELNVTMTLDNDNIPMPEDFTTFQLELKTSLEQPDHKLFKQWNATIMQQTVAVTHTVFNVYDSGSEINLWVIIGSVAAGLVLIGVIVLVIWKLGFFERKQHFQVAKWRSESQKSRRNESQKSRS